MVAAPRPHNKSLFPLAGKRSTCSMSLPISKMLATAANQVHTAKLRLGHTYRQQADSRHLLMARLHQQDYASQNNKCTSYGCNQRQACPVSALVQSSVFHPAVSTVSTRCHVQLDALTSIAMLSMLPQHLHHALEGKPTARKGERAQLGLAYMVQHSNGHRAGTGASQQACCNA